MKLRIFKESKVRVPRDRLAVLFELIFRARARTRKSGQINLVFTTNKRIRALNKQFRNVDRPTDVLSFGFDDPVDPEDTYGEVYVSVPMAKRQARQFRTTLTHELLRLACHGMLHLFGYEHTGAVEAGEMETLERDLLRCLRSR